MTAALVTIREISNGVLIARQYVAHNTGVFLKPPKHNFKGGRKNLTNRQ